MQPATRPTGVTIIAVLNIIGGIIMLIGGIALIAVGSIFPSVFEQEDIESDMSGLMAGAFGVLGIALGGIILALGIFSFIVAYGLLKGMGWAWTLTVVLSIISLVLNVISLATGNFGGIISIIINAVVLYYLFRPNVKAYFGKSKASQP